MNPIAKPSMPGIKTTFAQRRLAREWKTVTAMIHIYCRDQHGGALCSECEALKHYVSLRLDRCRFGVEKPTCAKCPVHCYQKDRREQIKAIMRYAGPKMIWEHPWLSLWHLLDGWFRRADLVEPHSKPTASAGCRGAAAPAAPGVSHQTAS